METAISERNIEERPIWSLELYKNGFQLFGGRAFRVWKGVPQLFPGVSAVDLTGANSNAIAFDELFRVQRDRRASEWYFQSELNYGYRKTRQASKSITNANSPQCVAASTPGLLNPPVSASVTAGCGDPYLRSQTADFFYNEFGYAKLLRTGKGPYGWKVPQLPVALQNATEAIHHPARGVSRELD